MMRYVSILILLLSQLVSWGQENERFLILEEIINKKKVKIHKVKEGKKLEVITKNGAEFYGNYMIVSDSIIMVNDSLIMLDQIAMVSAKTTGVRVLRGTALAAGSAVTLWGVAVLIYFGTILPEHLIVAAVDIPVLIYLQGSSRGKSFYIEDKERDQKFGKHGNCRFLVDLSSRLLVCGASA